MAKILLIDGNSILNRAFYGIMGSKMLMTEDGTYTNAVYGFLSIMFKVLDDLKPEYMVVAFDRKGPTKRHEIYKEYKANRKGMPEELAMQMPMIKEVLEAMNIKIIEKDGYEGDDIIGTLSRFGEENNLDVTILSGDRDNFQLATDKITVQIPHTKAGKTETDYYNRAKVLEEYGVEPYQLIQVKGLMGDSSDNIPGVPGVGEKTALQLIKDYKDIDKIYEKLEDGTDTIKGKVREKLVANKELALLSRELGRINIDSPIEKDLEQMKVEQWDNTKVLELFRKYRFNRFIERFSLKDEAQENVEQEAFPEIKTIESENQLQDIKKIIQEEKKIAYYFTFEEDNSEGNIINKKISSISISDNNKNIVYYYKVKNENIFIKYFKEVFEDENIQIYGYELSRDYIILKQIGIKMNNLVYDAKIAAYLLNPTASKYMLNSLAMQYLNIDIEEYIQKNAGTTQVKQQMNLFEDTTGESNNKIEQYETSIYAYSIKKLNEITIEKLKEQESLELFKNIEMPLVKVLAQMQYDGMYINKEELIEYGDILKKNLIRLTQEIYDTVGIEFNINSTKQLGEILFEKLQLPYAKKNKNGYSTDVDTLEKLKGKHPVIDKILEYRGVMKLNSTYVEGLLPYINKKDNRIHSYFHQTVTATGRISSTEPNLQNIPTRVEAGKKIRKAFKPSEGSVFLDADYSQIELRVLAHISEDEHMIEAFRNNEDIHKQAASKVLNIPIEEVTQDQRSKAKAVNFGIVYGISDFGLAEQIGTTRKEAKKYIEQYLEKYSGIKKFMEDITEEAKEKGYVETLFHRRRNLPELKSTNYMIRQFGQRAAMNTPIQGTAADIMKIAMITTFEELNKRNLKSKIVLQVHDELLIDTVIEEKEEVKEILKTSMENAIKLKIPLKVELSEAKNWYEAK